MQKEDYGGRLIASDLTNPDFVRMAESFGAVGLRAAFARGAAGARCAAALKEPGPVLIEVPIGETPAPWEFIQLPRVRPSRHD